MSKTCMKGEVGGGGGLRIEEAILQLDHHGTSEVVEALFALIVFAQGASDNDTELQPSVPKLLRLLGSSDAVVKRNACVALACVVRVNHACWADALTQDAAVELVDCLSTAKTDTVLQLNSAAALGSLVEGGPEKGSAAVLAAQGGAAALLRLCDVAMDERLQEAGADAVCKLAAEQQSRQHLEHAGAVEVMAGLLWSKSMQVVVLSLLALGMLIGGRQPERQRRVLEVPGAAMQLMTLMRQTKDDDARQISAHIFATLANNDDMRKELTLAVQENTSQETDRAVYLNA